MKKVLVIAGVTGAGKSRLSLDLAEQFNGEIISADSVAVYNELSIGSAKPTAQDMMKIKHHLINIQSYKEPFDVSQFQKMGRSVIDLIHTQGKLPIVVGGTGLYINALLKDYEFVDHPELIRVPTSITNEEMFQYIQKHDAKSSEKIHVNNRKRLERVYQILTQTSLIPSESNNAGDSYIYDVKIIFLQGQREKLYERINLRVDSMFEQGLLEEVESIYHDDSSCFSRQSMSAIGYREFEEYFLGNQTLDSTKGNIKQNTRRFAKRQVTWFKHQVDAEWIDIENPVDLEKLDIMIKEWL